MLPVRHPYRLLLPLALLLALLGIAPVRAEVPGQADPSFQAALADWLADDDQASLPRLASLAAEDNRAAQILLALIDTSPPLQGPWLLARSRAQRIALMRQPGGMSGRSWMTVAAADTPLAATWLAYQDLTAQNEMAVARAFAELGEPRAVRQTLAAAGWRLHHGFAAIADAPFYPPSLRYLLWRDWADDPASAPRIAAEIAALAPGDPQIRLYAAGPVLPADRAAWLAAAPIAAPLRAFCAATCPGSPASCAEAGFAFVRGLPGLVLLGSPVEALVQTEIWNDSPRGRAAILRQPAFPAAQGSPSAATIAKDSCFSAALAGETARFAR